MVVGFNSRRMWAIFATGGMQRWYSYGLVLSARVTGRWCLPRLEQGVDDFGTLRLTQTESAEASHASGRFYPVQRGTDPG